MIFIALIMAAAAVATLAVVVAGVQATDHRMSLRERSTHGWADGFARRVLGVYVRQPTGTARPEDRTNDGQGRR